MSASVLVVLAAGCGSAGGESTAVASGSCTADRIGGSVTQGTLLTPRGLDPVGQPGAAGSGGTEVQALFDTLMTYNTESQVYEPQVAESLTPNADFTVWTMTLREGIRYGNGDILVADDVKRNVERHQSPANTQVSRGEALTIASMDVPDPRTIRFTLDSAYPNFPHVLATDVGMVTNPRVVDALGPEQFALNPRGAGVGPYELAKYAPGEEIVMTAKPDYWGGPVCIQALRFISIPGAEGTLDALRTGELDVALLREPPAIAEARGEGFASLPTLFNYGEGIVMNSAPSRPAADVRLRRAIVAAVDPDAVNTRVFNGTALATSALIHKDTPGLYSGATGPSYDPDLAKELVSEAKRSGWDGTIRLLADNSPIRINEAIAVKALLENVGFTVQLENDKSLAEVVGKVASDRDYDLVIWGPNYTNEGLWALMNRQLNSQSKSNYYGYADPRMDDALAALRTATSPEQEQEIVARMQEILDDSPVIANFAAYEEDNVHSSRVGGLILTRGSVLRYDKAFVAGA
ncbi:ABC transporter substrate-binding protein [Rhodococcus sp. T2V]|uniref:ABC transporter substrate-binding protein n=1 Tax=Rhodococcus sp. T2V TaxID=3034164 RepID=UPI0023E1D21B|nr:ABC transporter substrate-binding protein [Rhodococcus sp. T2V]MDF3308180.1 ABC transporter substrate-binding protein [Rhodococcus sp. T2V]